MEDLEKDEGDWKYCEGRGRKEKVSCPFQTQGNCVCHQNALYCQT